MEVLLSDTVMFVWNLEWTVSHEELIRHFQQFGSIFRAMHIFNPFTGEKKGYGFVDFVDGNVVKRSTHGANNSKMFEIKGQRGWYGKFLPKNLKRDLMYMEDKVGNMLLKQLYQKVPDSGTWGGGQDHQQSIKEAGGTTLSKRDLPVCTSQLTGARTPTRSRMLRTTLRMPRRGSGPITPEKKTRLRLKKRRKQLSMKTGR